MIFSKKRLMSVDNKDIPLDPNIRGEIKEVFFAWLDILGYKNLMQDFFDKDSKNHLEAVRKVNIIQDLQIILKESEVSTPLYTSGGIDRLTNPSDMYYNGFYSKITNKFIKNSYQNLTSELAEVLYFSDSIQIIFPSVNNMCSCEWFVGLVRKVCLKLFSNDIFVRGGISYGKHYNNQDCVISEALTRAYLMEQEAEDIRILFDGSISLNVSEFDIIDERELAMGNQDDCRSNRIYDIVYENIDKNLIKLKDNPKVYEKYLALKNNLTLSKNIGGFIKRKEKLNKESLKF